MDAFIIGFAAVLCIEGAVRFAGPFVHYAVLALHR
jgi:hypothetical protein